MTLHWMQKRPARRRSAPLTTTKPLPRAARFQQPGLDRLGKHDLSSTNCPPRRSSSLPIPARGCPRLSTTVHDCPRLSTTVHDCPS
ncbi:hypothetical protein M3J09_010308 [Ascochyta lentis]